MKSYSTSRQKYFTPVAVIVPIFALTVMLLACSIKSEPHIVTLFLSYQGHCNDSLRSICNKHSLQKYYQTTTATCQCRVTAKSEFCGLSNVVCT